MSKHKVVVGQNLRRLVENKGSIAEFCRIAEINRTQLHRYMTGKSMPRPSQLKRLANALGVNESVLFIRPALDERKVKQLSFSKHDAFKSIVALVEENGTTTIESGNYLTYFFVPNDEGMVVRAVTAISNSTRPATFNRFSGTYEPSESRWRFSRGRNSGFILEQRGNLFFAGMNCGLPAVPSLLTMQQTQTGRPLLVGSGIITARKGPAVASVVMERRPESETLRCALKMCSTISIRDKSLASDVKILLRENSFE